MFRNKVLVRAGPSSSAPPPPFLLRQLSFSTDVPSLDIEILCYRLSRRHRLACLPQPPTDVLLVYQRCQSRAAAVEVASEIAAAFPDASVGEEEEVVCSGSLAAKAVECGLRCLMLERGWRFVGDSIFVESTFAASEERTDLRALNVEVRSGLNDDYEFVVSPDAFRFTSLKISDVASSSMMETFQHINEVSLDGCNLQTACAILPTLQEGRVIGFSTLLPSGQSLDNFTELCSVKNGLETNYNYHAAVKLTCGVSWEKQWLPSPFVLQGSGLQPAMKSVRALKAMSSLQFFIELLTAWNFFGQNQLVIKEQLLVNCTATLPTWDKANSKWSVQTARTDNSEDLGLVRASSTAKDQSLNLDFRTPKPAVFCSSSAKVHKIAQCMDEDGYGNGTRSINHFCPSHRIVLTSSFESQATLLKPSFSRSKRVDGNKTRCSSEQSNADRSNKSSETGLPKPSQRIVLTSSFESQATLLKPSFSRSKRVDGNKTRCSSEQSGADRSNKSSETGLPKPSHRSSPKASHANAINSASPIILNQFIQASEYPKRKHAEFLENSSKGETAKGAINQENVPHISIVATRLGPNHLFHVQCTKKIVAKGGIWTKESEDTKSDVPQDTKSMLDIHKDVLSATISKSMVGKDEINAATKSKRKPTVVKDDLTKKAIDHQKDVTEKVAKAKAVLAKDELISTTKTKVKPDVNINELTEKVIEHHKRGELRLLTVADLKCFLGAKKAKVGGTKEVLIQRTNELLS